jgi:uncharacterized protein (TIGR00369 family)
VSSTNDHAPAGELAAKLGIAVIEITAQQASATMPVAGNRQPHGALNGGAASALAETLASLAGSVHAAGLGLMAVGQTVSVVHHRAAGSGLVTATARALHLGRRSATYQVELVDQTGHLTSSAQVTLALIEP